MPIDGDTFYNGEAQKRAHEVLSEVAITQQISKFAVSNNMQAGFIHCYNIAVCHGPYPKSLLSAWDAFEGDPERESLNDRPDEFGSGQLFVVFVFAHGGSDLEGTTLSSFVQTRVSVLMYVHVLSIPDSCLVPL